MGGPRGHGALGAFGAQLTALTLTTVAASILVHGATVHPFLTWYDRQGKSQPMH